MKKLLIPLLVLFLGLSTAVSAASVFPDVPEDHVNYEAIATLDERGIVGGYSDGTFGPDNLVTRAQAAKMIMGAMKVNFEGNYSVLFSDVPENEWFFKYVMGAEAAGIVKGNDGKFNPNDNVNLAETLKMIVLAGKVSLPTNIDADVFVDVPKDAWYAPHAEYAKINNIVVADDKGMLNAASSMTRAAFAEVVYRMMYVKENGDKPYPIGKDWGYFDSTELPFKMKYEDNSWDVIDRGSEVVFLKKDGVQFSEHRILSNSAVVSVVLDANEDNLTAVNYFAKLQESNKGAKFTNFNLKGKKALEVLYADKRIVDWYVYIDGKVLAVYTQFGDGPLGFKLKQQINTMLQSLELQSLEPEPDYTAILGEILAGVLKQNQGMALLNKLPEKVIVETDTIGVGTGPVDYYYSVSVDYTFKYERSDDLILDTREGKTTAF